MDGKAKRGSAVLYYILSLLLPLFEVLASESEPRSTYRLYADYCFVIIGADI